MNSMRYRSFIVLLRSNHSANGTNFGNYHWRQKVIPMLVYKRGRELSKSQITDIQIGYLTYTL